MNEYQQRESTNYQKSLGRLRLIVDELNNLDLGDVTDFEIQPIPEGYDFTPRFICISALIMEGPIEIICERNGYGKADRWEFRASGWPTYTDEHGNKSTIDPSNLYNPKEDRPVTTAQQDRAPLAIAKQIASKIIPGYIVIYQRCLERAQGAQDHSDETADAVRRLADACQDEREFRGRPQRCFYIRNCGDTYSKRVEFRSTGDVQMNLTTDEAIACIATLRELQAEKVAA